MRSHDDGIMVIRAPKIGDHHPLAHELESFDRKIDFATLFGRTAPVELEIGTGKGTFMLNRARAYPQHDFFGIEWASKFYRYALDRFARWELTNVRLCRTDALHLVTRSITAGSLAAVHIYFPDPWPKKRHHKRRLLQPLFAQTLLRVLSAGGRLAIATDHAEYFEQIEQVIGAVDGFVTIPFDDPQFGIADNMTGTNFETKYVEEGRPIHRLAVMKRN